MTLETRKLRGGAGSIDVTVLGFGGAPLGNLYVAVSDAVADATLAAAWDAGIRVFDTAPFYGFGLSEERFGRSPRRAVRATTSCSPPRSAACSDDCPPEDVPKTDFARHAEPHLPLRLFL